MHLNKQKKNNKILYVCMCKSLNKELKSNSFLNLILLTLKISVDLFFLEITSFINFAEYMWTGKVNRDLLRDQKPTIKGPFCILLSQSQAVCLWAAKTRASVTFSQAHSYLVNKSHFDLRSASIKNLK